MIYFFVGNNDSVGGMQNLFLNVSYELNKQGIETKIIANSNSYVADVLRDNNTGTYLMDFKKIDILYKKYDLSKDIIITTVLTSSGINKLHKLNPRILLWLVFPESLIEANSIRRFHIRTYTRILLESLYVKDSVVFIDKFHFDINNKFFKMDYNKGKLIIPNPIKICENLYLSRNFNDLNTIRISYLGRAVNWKFYPLLRLVLDLIKIKTDFKINTSLFVITDNVSYFKDKLLNYSDQLNILYQEGLYGNKLDDFLVSNSDIHFAMGTSCLDAAKLGIPSVVVDYGFNQFPENYQYKWIFNVKGYVLGENILSLKYAKPNNLKLIIDDFIKNKYQISSETYEYVKNNHSVSLTANKLHLQSTKSKGTLNDFTKLCLRNNRLIHFLNKLPI